MNALIVTERNEENTLVTDLFSSMGWNCTAANQRNLLQMIDSSAPTLIVVLSWNQVDVQRTVLTLRALGIVTPVICLGPQSATVKEVALVSGADEYLGWPVESAELEARIRNLLKRVSHLHLSALSVGSTSVDSRLRVVSYDGRSKQLSEFECRILAFLMANSKHTFTASDLFNSLWSSKENSSEATIRVHINSLRKKLDEIGAKFFIRTVRGKGYMVYQ